MSIRELQRITHNVSRIPFRATSVAPFRFPNPDPTYVKEKHYEED